MIAQGVSKTELSAWTSFWTAFPSLLWILLTLVALLLLRNEIRSLLQNLAWRLRTGSSIKFFSIDLGQSYVSPTVDPSGSESELPHRKDADERRWKQRQSYYVPNRNVQLVHRVAPSKQPGQLYDIQLYLIPHTGGTLVNVGRVEYYFGRSWQSLVFTSMDRGRGFPITTSAYGTFMCTAEVFFTDGDSVMLNRYVDFEMGALGRPGRSE